MGVLIDGGRDEELPQEVGRAGEFRRAESQFRNRITAYGSSGFKAEPSRYRLYVAHGCPWAHLAVAVGGGVFRSVGTGCGPGGERRSVRLLPTAHHCEGGNNRDLEQRGRRPAYG